MTVQVNDLVESYSTPEDCFYPAVRGQVIALSATQACILVQAVIDPEGISWRMWQGAPFTAAISFDKVAPITE